MMNTEEDYEALYDYFHLYNSFLQKDLVSSLSNKGRSEIVLYNFMKVFIIITDKDSLIEMKKDALSSLKEDYLEEYLEKTENHIINDKLWNHYILVRNDDSAKKIYFYSQNNFNENFNDFLEATTKFNEEVKGQLHKIALIEFNNALSHLYRFYVDNTNIENINKAAVHIYRGSLDYYKSIIKLNYDLISSNTKLFTKLSRIRIKEALSIGNCIRCKDKDIEDHISMIKDNLPNIYLSFLKEVKK